VLSFKDEHFLRSWTEQPQQRCQQPPLTPLPLFPRDTGIPGIPGPNQAGDELSAAIGNGHGGRVGGAPGASAGAGLPRSRQRDSRAATNRGGPCGCRPRTANSRLRCWSWWARHCRGDGGGEAGHRGVCPRAGPGVPIVRANSEELFQTWLTSHFEVGLRIQQLPVLSLRHPGTTELRHPDTTAAVAPDTALL